MKRWLIRIFFLGLLLLCMGGWGWSYPYREHLAYINGKGPSGPQTCVIEIGGGGIFLGKDWGYLEGRGWIYYHADKDDFANDLAGAGTQLFGFQFFAHPALGSFVIIPFYFPTTISAALLWLVWRKTRPRVKGRAFPVELNKPSG